MSTCLLCTRQGWAVSQHYFLASPAQSFQVGELLPNFYRLRTKVPKLSLAWLYLLVSKRQIRESSWIQSPKKPITEDRDAWGDPVSTLQGKLPKGTCTCCEGRKEASRWHSDIYTRRGSLQETTTTQAPSSLGPTLLLPRLCKQVAHGSSPADERAVLLYRFL